MHRQLPTPYTLGDVEDLEALIAELVRIAVPGVDSDEHEELKREGFVLAWKIFGNLPHGHSLAQALSDELPSDLKDHRKSTPEGRYLRTQGRRVELESLSEERTAEEAAPLLAEDRASFEERQIESRFVLRAVEGDWRDFRDPQMLRRLLHLESPGSVGTAASWEIAATLREEREQVDEPFFKR